MKTCPTCSRTFEDTFTFCLADGSLLDAPFDPQATLVIPEPIQTEPPPTEVFKLEETKQEIPPTVASPQPEQKPEEVVSTIAAPAPTFELPHVKDSPAQPAPKSKRYLWIIGGVLVIAVGAVILFMTRDTRDTAAKHAKAGYSLWGQSKFIEAEQEYRQAIKLEPKNAEHYKMLAYVLNAQKKYGEAEPEIREALRLQPDDDQYQRDLADILVYEEKYPQAEQEFRNLLQLANNESKKIWLPLYHWRLGMVLEKEKKLAEAEAEYREAIRLEPNYTTYQESLKKLLDAQKK
jgi:tetratricopeptide (TPR) repeat protein